MPEAKTALVTGAGAGIGAAIARSLARQGMTVVVAEINEDMGREVADSLAALGGAGEFIATDVTCLDQVRSLMSEVIARHGAVDILINNAYPIGESPAALVDQDEARLDRAMNGGFRAAAMTMKLAWPGMQQRNWGRVVNICSLNGVNAHPHSSEYNASKEALRSFTRTAAVEWAKDGITCNIVCPGAKTTSLTLMEQFAPEMMSDILKMVPMGYMGDPDRDIAPVVDFLVSRSAAYLTGNTLFVDGGGHINGVPWKP